MSILRYILLIVPCFIASGLHAQVTLDPFFASQFDTVTVYYDATLGNGALTGQPLIYAHTGVITDQSSGP